ncbi:uncharacterized protein LOC134177648 [Corticium candelabrum]|uniref:uncharacterized protein LOC134177648 n=1 Tax=Corticium candelabrum TaxID=121492 RepID=UPI002E25B30A|nr:uncharacterized protein LOC134177648 [Corticium candelabrum]
MRLILILVVIGVQSVPFGVTASAERIFELAIGLPSESADNTTSASDIREALERALEDVNARRGHSGVRLHSNFTLTACILENVDSPAQAFGALFSCLTTGSPKSSIAAIAPFYPSHVPALAATTTNDIPLVSPVLSRANVSDYLFQSTEHFVSMFYHNLFRGFELVDGSILDRYKWKDLAILVSNTSEATEAVLQLQNFNGLINYTIVKEEIVAPVSDKNATFSSSIKRAIDGIKDSGVTIIITSLEARVEVYHAVFSEANRQGIVGEDYAWICLSLPSQSVFESSPLYRDTVPHMEGVLGTQVNMTADETSWNVSQAILKNPLLANTYDSVWSVALAIDASLRQNVTLNFSKPDNFSFSYLLESKMLLYQLKSVRFVGVSGHVAFQNDGTREPRFDVFNIVKNSSNHANFDFIRVFQWNQRSKLIETGPTPRWHGGGYCVPVGKLDACRRKLRVLVASEYRPYIQYHSNRQGNERFSGWAVDVFKYVIKGCVENYELERHNGTWIKMLTSLIQQNSTYDMAIAPLPFYILNLTHFGVTFTKNIGTFTIRALVTQRKDPFQGFDRVLDPFSIVVWICIFVFFVLAGIVIYLLERKRDEFPEGAPGLWDSIFYSFSTLSYTQDLDAAITLPGRVFVLVICFAVLILTSCFTANLTVSILQTNNQAFTTFEELKQQKVGVLSVHALGSYLTGKTGFSFTFNETNIISFPDTTQVDAALRNGTISAFLDDEGVVSVLQSEDASCQLATVKATLKDVHVGFALRSTALSEIHKDLINFFDSRILTAWDDGYFEELEERYFPVGRQHINCQEGSLSGNNRALNLLDMAMPD